MKKIILMILSLLLAAVLPMSMVACDVDFQGTPGESTPGTTTPEATTPIETTPAHSHVWQEEYTSDEMTHWLKCTGCDEINAFGTHTSDENGICTICGHLTVLNVLVIEGVDGESERLVSLMDERYAATVVNASDYENIPFDIISMANYDAIFLVNVSHNDLLLYEQTLSLYVEHSGGRLLTICGGKEGDDGWEFNAFTREDMLHSQYSDLLPVEIVDSAAPSAVMFVIDTSGSMYVPGGSITYEESPLYKAQLAVESTLDVLSDTDYVGIMTLSDSYKDILPLTRFTDKDAVKDALLDMPGAGGRTIFSDALQRAGRELDALSGVQNRHIVVITDGSMSPDDVERTLYVMSENENMGITMSFFGMDMNASSKAQMTECLKQTLSEKSYDLYFVDDVSQLSDLVKGDAEALVSTPAVFTSFKPTANADHPILDGVNIDDIPSLGAFCHSKLKEGAEAVLMGPYSPIYAVHSYGKGKVGSFMCDLSGVFSQEFINSEIGRKIINNIIKDLIS